MRPSETAKLLCDASAVASSLAEEPTELLDLLFVCPR